MSALAVLLLLASAAAAGAAWRWRLGPFAVAPGVLTLETDPEGVEATIGTRLLGRTPLSVALAPGTYAVQLGEPFGNRIATVQIASRASVVQHFERPAPPPAPAAVTGSLQVETDPSRLTVQIDGVARGTSPLSVAELTPGDHDVAVVAQDSTIRRRISIRAGESLSLVLSASSLPYGWLTVQAPLTMQIHEGDVVVGTTGASRILLKTGDHALDFVDGVSGYRTQKTLHVTSGRTTSWQVNLPGGRLSINAMPWAEVWLDGVRVGQTPLGNLPLAAGVHDVIFRHPDLGERKTPVTVVPGRTARISVDFTKR